MNMANEIIIIQILFITAAMVAIGLIFNKLLGINPNATRDIQERTRNLQDRMKEANTSGDYQELRQLQQESLQLTKQMVVKQFLPNCLRLILFFVIFAVLGMIYADYGSGLLPFTFFNSSGWFGIYMLFSISLSLFIMGIKRLLEHNRKKKTDIYGLSNMGLYGIYFYKKHETVIVVDVREEPPKTKKPRSLTKFPRLNDFSLKRKSQKPDNPDKSDITDDSDDWKKKVQE